MTLITASLSELKQNPIETVAAGDGFPVVILDNNEPAFYCIPIKAYQALMDKLDDIELAAFVEQRKNQAEISVEWNAI
jgi:antitoxin StbD